MERIAKTIARYGYCSRRNAEKLIALKRVKLNGKILLSPAINVSEEDIIEIDNQVITDKNPKIRLFAYYKPVGLLCTNKDEKQRKTIFDALPENLPRLVLIGRLDLNSEGLILLTTNGDFAGKMELPANKLKRVYKARVLGKINEEALKKLSLGTEIDGVKYGRVKVTVKKNTSAANNWVEVELTEGKNREVRKILASVGLKVNRLIRKAYGPYELGNLKAGEIKELKITAELQKLIKS